MIHLNQHGLGCRSLRKRYVQLLSRQMAWYLLFSSFSYILLLNGFLFWKTLLTDNSVPSCDLSIPVLLQPGTDGRRLLALKFVAALILIYTPDPNSSTEPPSNLAVDGTEKLKQATNFYFCFLFFVAVYL